MAQQWKALAAEKTQRFARAIPREWLASSISPPEQVDVTTFPQKCALLSDKELEITEVAHVGFLLKKLATAQWSAVEVTTAFCKSAAVAHQLTNCLTEVLFDRALARAEKLDTEFKANGGRPTGMLYGLPVSLKDQFQIKGVECNMGIVGWIGHISEKDSVLVEILEEQGAM